nr:putative reverse transcriptase domain-containing protein [Tanacetum cinerariifolium]
CKLLAVGSPFFWQWEHPPLAVGTYTASRNSLLAVGMPCAFYSQQDGWSKETTKKIVQIKNRLLTARSHQKSYADVRCKLMEFEVGDMVMLKVSPWKGAIRFGKRGVTPPKKAQKFKKHASPKLSTIPVSPEEPTRKSKRKEKVTIAKRKGIDLLFEVALTEEAQYEEIQKKSLRDFHKTHPSGSGTVTKIAPSAAKIKPSVTNKGTGAKPWVPGVTKEESSKSEAGSWGRDEDDSNNDHDSRSEGSDQESDNVEDDEEEKDDEFVKTASNSTDDEDETNVKDRAKGDEDKGMDYTTNQFDDDVDVRLNEPVNTDEWLIQKEGTDAEMINVQQGNENLEITLNQVVENDHVTISSVAKKTEVLVTSSSHSSNLAANFLNFVDIPTTDAEIVSLIDVHVHHEDDLLNTQVTAVVDEQLDSRLGATRDEFMSYLLASITDKITKQVKIQLPQILPKEVSNFAPSVNKNMVTGSLNHAVLANVSSQQKLIKSYDLDKSLFSTYDKVYSLKRSQKDKDKHVDPSTGSDRGLKKKKTSKDDEPTKGPKAKESKSSSSKGTKSQSKSFGKSVHAEEPEFEVVDSEMPQDQEENLEKLDWENQEGGDYPFDLTKPLPLVINGNRQTVPVDYFFNNNLKYLQEGILTMTYTTSITKTKAAQYDLPVTQVEIIQKHGYGYGYLREVEVLRANNDLYTFKEGDFL